MSGLLHAPIEPFRTHRIAVGDGHELYVEEVGHPDGIPVVVLHGGPGAGAAAHTRRFFDPERFRAVLFDQRGALRSTPLGSLDHNTTAHLVRDIAAVRTHLGIDRWLVFGGSWGVALALAYAELEADRIAGLILRGIYLARRAEDLWQYQSGASHLLPEAWDDYLESIAPGERADLIAAYHRRLTGEDEAVQLEAARAFLLWGVRTNAFLPDTDAEDMIRADYAAPFVVATARIAAHYGVHGSFLPHDGYLLEVAARTRQVPATLIHGRYDLAVPVSSAFDLKVAMPHAELRLIEAAGHTPADDGLTDALLGALDAHARSFDPD